MSDQFKFLGYIGDGTFGTVMEAEDLKSGEKVAIKRIKKQYASWEEGININEVKVMLLLKHPNLVATKQIYRKGETFYYVMEYMNQNLYEYIRDQRYIPEDDVRIFMYQLFQGLDFLHKHNVFHRDIKPENLLIKGKCLKIGDFGLCRKASSTPPYTSYVSTRWYRAPEILLRSKRYSTSVDVWAAGCIMAEMLMSSPLFPGINEEDELCRMCRVLGQPTESSWKEGIELAHSNCFMLPSITNTHSLKTMISTASSRAIDLLQKLLVWDPDKRLTAHEALCHEFFVSSFHPY